MQAPGGKRVGEVDKFTLLHSNDYYSRSVLFLQRNHPLPNIAAMAQNNTQRTLSCPQLLTIIRYIIGNIIYEGRASQLEGEGLL